MSESTTPNIGGDLLRIHAIITRGLTVGIENSRSLADRGHVDAAIRNGFIAYVQTLVTVVHMHHQLEDELAFPSVRDRIVDAPFDSLMAQHQEMLPVLADVMAATEQAAADSEISVPLITLNEALSGFAGIWHPHIKVEQSHLNAEVAAQLFTLEENARLSRAFGEYSQQHARPDYLVVPFLLYNLEPEQRLIQARAMPPIVTDQLVPIVWKDKWAPMMPFLLP